MRCEVSLTYESQVTSQLALCVVSLQPATIALSAFINAMHDTNNCAIVRRVYAANAKVQLGCLVPHIKHDYEVMTRDDPAFILIACVRSSHLQSLHSVSRLQRAALRRRRAPVHFFVTSGGREQRREQEVRAEREAAERHRPAHHRHGPVQG